MVADLKTDTLDRFILKKREKEYTRYKKYGVHQGLNGLFDLVWLQYSSSVHKTHSPSARVCSPSTLITNSMLGLKKLILCPWHTIYYYYFY